MNFLRKILPYIVILALSFFAFKPLLVPGFFPIHDDAQVARVYEMTKALRDGMFPVRWSQDLGYGFGYPIFNFYNPFPYYLASFFGILGVDALLSTKLMVILGVILSFISMYILSKEFWGRWGGILSASLYGLAPYHAVDLYVRGDFTESLAYSFIPLIFYGLWKIHLQSKWEYVILTSLSFAAVIISHNLTALIISPFLILFLMYLLLKEKFKDKKTVNYLLLSLSIGVFIAAFYWLPAILEMKYTNILSQIGGGADFRDHFVCLQQLWSSPWGYGGSAKGCIDGVSFMIGKYHMILLIISFLISIIFLFSKRESKNANDKVIIILVSSLGFLISAFLTIDISRFIWEAVGPMSFIQYPWRFLIMMVFFSSFIAGSFLWVLENFLRNKNFNFAFFIVFIVFSTFSNSKFFNSQMILNKVSSDYTSVYSLKWTTSKISDEYMPVNFQKPKSFIETQNILKINSQEISVLDYSQKAQELNLDLNIHKPTTVVIPLAYFPSWKAYLDRMSVELFQDKKGILVDLPQGKHNLRLTFVQTPIEIIGNYISITALLVLFGYNAMKKKYE